MSIYLTILAFLIMLVVLVKSADILSDSLVLISQKLGINTFITGFVILSAASTLPEISVALSSSIQGAPNISIGNLLGASAFLLSVVVSLLAIKNGEIPFRGSFNRNDLIISLTLIFAQVLFMLNGTLSMFNGVVLVCGYFAIITYFILRSNRSAKLEVEPHLTQKKISVALLKSVVAIILLLLSANFIVQFAVDIATILKLPQIFIGIIMLGIGTNLPELTILFTSRSVEQSKLAVGNFIGSAVANAATLGVLGILSPQVIRNFYALIPVLFVLGVISILFGYFAWSDHKFTRREAYVLLTIFLISVIWQFVTVAN